MGGGGVVSDLFVRSGYFVHRFCVTARGNEYGVPGIRRIRVRVTQHSARRTQNSERRPMAANPVLPRSGSYGVHGIQNS